MAFDQVTQILIAPRSTLSAKAGFSLMQIFISAARQARNVTQNVAKKREETRSEHVSNSNLECEAFNTPVWACQNLNFINTLLSTLIDLVTDELYTIHWGLVMLSGVP